MKKKELSALAVKRLTRRGRYAVGGGAGLALEVTSSGGRSWILRTMIAGRRREMGLGGYPDVPLTKARDLAREAKEKIQSGIDPIAERQAARSALMASHGRCKTFQQCAEAYISSHESSWKNPKCQQQWRNTLKTYAYPVIGKLFVQDIEMSHILNILEPIWKKITETATRVRSRMENILSWATARGYRKGANPAEWRGNLDQILPAPSKVAKHKHHKAMAVSAVGSFMKKLRGKMSMGAMALEFNILTAARSGETRKATWSEIDLEKRVWTIPAERMKAGKEHRVPLSDAVIRLLQSVPRMAGTDLVFPSSKNTPLSDMTLTKVLRDMGLKETVHGFRSSFRDWTAEQTNYPHDVCEMALAHTIENKVEAAYRRTDLFMRRKALMADWAKFCDQTYVSEVVSLASHSYKAATN